MANLWAFFAPAQGARYHIHSLLRLCRRFTGETNVQTLQFVEKAIKKASEANTLIADLLHFRPMPTRSHAKGKDRPASLAAEIASSYSAQPRIRIFRFG